MEEEIYITPIHVRDYLFCPTILYQKHVRRIIEPETQMMMDGKEEYEKDKETAERRKSILGEIRIQAEKTLFSVPLKSEKYKVVGIADAIYWKNNKMHILEIKYSETKKPYPDHIYQTTTYAIMAEETLKQTAYKIILYYKPTKLWHERILTKQLKNHTIKIIQKTHEIINGKTIPPIKQKTKCKTCWYNRICHGN
ncbi:MAG: CRISPR-associated protein Cas4 [Candidatus Methanomethylicia archaeon]